MILKMKKIGSRFISVITLVVVRTTKKIVGPPDPLSWWSCGPLVVLWTTAHKSLCQTLVYAMRT